jgi:hypothetical protein
MANQEYLSNSKLEIGSSCYFFNFIPLVTLWLDFYAILIKARYKDGQKVENLMILRTIL